MVLAVKAVRAVMMVLAVVVGMLRSIIRGAMRLGDAMNRRLYGWRLRAGVVL